jgi:hypothetical protein
MHNHAYEHPVRTHMRGNRAQPLATSRRRSIPRHSAGALQDKLGVAYAGIADTFRRVHRVRCEHCYALIHDSHGVLYSTFLHSSKRAGGWCPAVLR